MHTRLRTGCSSLNHDLFVKHITDSPLCFCGETENTEHYFLSCPLYQNQRIDLNIAISRYTQVTLQVILFGSSTLPLNANKAILYEEVKWDTLEERRRKHKLALFYKMVNGLSPPYLSSLIPLPRASSYNLRNTNDIQTIHARTNQYYNSFLPSVIRDWNNLTLDTRNSDSLHSFKRNLNNNDRFVPKYFYSGIRKLQILHTRLRTGCSSLNHDLFVKHITDSPLCFCGETENTEHYFLSCPLYQNQRIDLNIAISRYTQVTLQVILFGSSTLPLNANKAIFEAVHKYIKESKRF